MAPTGRKPCCVLLDRRGCAFLPLMGFTVARAEGCTSQGYDLSAYNRPVRGTCIFREVRAYVIQSFGLARNEHVGIQRVGEGRECTRVLGTEDTEAKPEMLPINQYGGWKWWGVI